MHPCSILASLRRWRRALMAVFLGLAAAAPAAEPAPTTLTIAAECAGLSGFRAHWDQPIPVAADGARLQKDGVVKDRGQTAVWDGVKPGPLAFDAVHRSLLVRFPGAAEQIAAALAGGQTVAQAELVLPYLDEELWPQGGQDFPRPDGYRYRTNWDCDKLYRAQRPNWHAMAYALRRPWQADAAHGPTYNAAIHGAVYWARFGASDPESDRFPTPFGPTEVSSYQPAGRMVVTPLLTDAAYGKTLSERLRRLADCGFLVNKQEVYDARYFQGAYEWAISTGPRAILIQAPTLVITLAAGPAEKLALPPPADVAALATQHRAKPLGVPTAVVPSAAAVAALNERFLARPAWMPEWQYARVRELMALESGGVVQPFYYRVAPEYVTKDVIAKAKQKAGKGVDVPQAELDYAVYLSWLDWIHGRPPRFWEGHLTAANNITEWYNYRDAMPAPVQESIRRCWTAWLMPDRETAMTDKQRKDFGDRSGALIHPMADDPRVGVDATGKVAEWGQGDTYYKLTGDWRGNKSYYRSGFTRMMSTANFNSSAASGALLNGQIIGAERAMDDGRAGLMRYPFWLWTYNAGVGQEYVDHYYWAIATAGNKLFPDFAERPEDRMAGWSILAKTVEDLAGAYHPNLKKLIAPASRTYYEHVLGQQDGLYHILHVLSPRGALCDTATGGLPALSANEAKPLSAWGHDFPPAAVALQSLSGPWGDPWTAELLDEKPLPWSAVFEKKVVTEGDWVTTYFGVNYGLATIRQTPQRIHVLAQWRRAAALPTTMRELGTLDLRIGYNQTQIGNDGAGVISEQGHYRTYQHRNKLLMLARPNAEYLGAQMAAKQDKQGKETPGQEVRSVQCTAALFNFELPAPTWDVYVDETRLAGLPATAKLDQVITLRDGVSYLALRALPTDDVGRDAELTLAAGVPQSEAYHDQVRIRPALLVNAHFYQRDAPLAADGLGRLADACGGFAVELGDEAEYGSFAKFQAHVRAAQLSGGPAGEQGYAVTYQSGADTLAAQWRPAAAGAAEQCAFTVNGADPYPTPAQGLWRDTPLTQMGLGRLEKSGAVIERARGEHPLLLQTFPQQRIYVAMNPLPTYQAYSFRTPGGVRIVADGLCSMSRWAVREGGAIEVRYHAFADAQVPAAARATVLFISGTKAQPAATLNGQPATLREWRQGEVAGWLLQLGGPLPADTELRARLAAGVEGRQLRCAR